MANKKKQQSEKAKPTGVSIPAQILKRAQRLAFTRQQSFSSMVTHLLARELEAAR